jgi:hypothetical protein
VLIKECKAISKSIIYFAFVAVVVLFYATQFGNSAGNDIKQFATQEETLMEPLSQNPLIAPIFGQDNYGFRNAEIPEQVMPNAISRLLGEYANNSFISYPIGFYRNVKLSDKQLSEIETLLMEMTGLSANKLLSIRNEKAISDGSMAIMQGAGIDFSEAIPIIISYDEFKEDMKHIDKMIGGGSYYDPSNLKQYGSIEITYEEKLAEHDVILNSDRITGAYARLFCDYMGITLALFSVFVPVSFLLRDRRSKMNELIYSRKKSSASIVLTRYFALVCMTLLPFILLSLIPTVQLSVFAAQHSMSVDYLAFIKYIGAWLVPTVLATTAIAYCFTMLTDTPIAIILQLVWSLYGVFSSANVLEGGRYGIEIAIRHNKLGNLQLVQESMKALIANRLSYTAVSLVLILVTVFLFNLKRRGRLNVFNGFKKAIRNR